MVQIIFFPDDVVVERTLPEAGAGGAAQMVDLFCGKYFDAVGRFANRPYQAMRIDRFG